MSNHKQAIERQLWQRDYELVADHHPALLDEIEKAIEGGVSAEQIKRWVVGNVEENLLVQRVYNAARHCEANK